MNFATLLPLVIQYGPSIIPIVQKLVTAVRDGKGNTEVTDADWNELVRLSNQTGEDIYARSGITPPPVRQVPE